MASVADAGRPVREELDQLRAADDAGSSDQIVLVQLALLEARRTYPDRAAGLDEVVHQVLERRKAFLMNAVREALLRQPYALYAQEHQRLLVGRGGCVGNDEGNGSLVGIVFGKGEADAKFSGSGHDRVSFQLC
jgi:hypothetical protein